MIEEAALIDMILHTRSQVDFLWQFFVTVHIAIFALLFIYDDAVENLNFLARALAIAGIAIFDWINGNALKNSYLLLDAAQDQYKAWYGAIASRDFHPEFFQYFVEATFADRPGMVNITHGLAFVVVILALLTSRFIQGRQRHLRS
jgi:hypothetical protein